MNKIIEYITIMMLYIVSIFGFILEKILWRIYGTK